MKPLNFVPKVPSVPKVANMVPKVPKPVNAGLVTSRELQGFKGILQGGFGKQSLRKRGR